MIDNWTAVDRIEQAERETPFCVCGEAMSTAAYPNGIWLECASLRQPGDSRFGRLLAAITGGSHNRRLIVDLVDEAA